MLSAGEYPWSSEEDIGFSGTGVGGSCEMPLVSIGAKLRFSARAGNSFNH